MCKRRIICFHLYNDFSGSPHVLSLVLKGLIEKGYQVDLYTSNTDGFLSGIPKVNYHLFYYRWTRNKFRTAFFMLYAQAYMFFVSLSYINIKNAVFYLNTICPFGAAIGGFIIRKKIIYHLHEKYINPNILHKTYNYVHIKTSNMTFYVSKYLMNEYLERKKSDCVIYNALSPTFIQGSMPRINKDKRILMITSLKEYKGVFIFLQLAKLLPQYYFDIIVSANEDELRSFFPEYDDIENLCIYSTQKNIHPFLCKAGIVLNLSLPNLCVESFGLTILEAMSYGIPVICPPVGGPTELVIDSYNGYLIDSRNIELLRDKIIYIFESGDYARLSKNAITKFKDFSYTIMIDKIDINLQKIL